MINKKGQMEMSMGTIVTIVLLVTLLVLGVVLIKNIMGGATNVVDLTNAQLENEVNKLFSTDSKIAVYPGTREVKLKQETNGGIGFGIKNLQTGTATSGKFSYLVSAADVGNCGITKEVANTWIILGKAESDIAIPIGDNTIRKVIFNIPSGAPLCMLTYKIEVKVGTAIYASDSFQVEIKAK